MATVEREYDFSQPTYGSGDGDFLPDGSEDEEAGGGSGCIGHVIWALVIYGLAIVLAVVIPGRRQFLGHGHRGGKRGHKLGTRKPQRKGLCLWNHAVAALAGGVVGRSYLFSRWNFADHHRLVDIAV